ncbi:hypothetical protein BHM03_00014001 [Ensete ventricosum]|nr:hypothetical protein BHM03_00014001 [Ensete ventricosum]
MELIVRSTTTQHLIIAEEDLPREGARHNDSLHNSNFFGKKAAMDKTCTGGSSGPRRIGLKHRFARMLLGSSCSSTATATDVIKLSSSALRQQIVPEEYSICRSGDGRRKLRDPSSFPSNDGGHRHRVAPVVQGSVHRGARRFGHELNKEGGVTETGERRKCDPAPPYSPMRNCYCRSHDEDKKKKACGRRGSSRRKATGKLLSSNGYGFKSSSSSLDCNDELGLFSSGEEEEESGTLFSSKSFSSDSSEFYCNNHGRGKKNKKKSGSKSMKSNEPSRENATRKLWPLASLSSAEKKHKAAAEMEVGFPVVKKSSDPYMDFRSSMLEMIVERQMSSAGDMEKLLHSYLSLNSHLHHPVILEAFLDALEAILGE